jgi:hypothetical protein
MTHPTSPELALTIACCRWPRSTEREAAVREAAALVTDWNLFEHLVARHRVTPLVRDALACAGVAPPPAVDERLGARAAQCAVTALAMAGESVRLQRAFQAAGLPLLVVKGTAVGILAYGDPCMKESWDIDLLTAPQAIPEAHSLLGQLGYELDPPVRLTGDRLKRLLKVAKDASYLHRESGLTVELHWRLMRNRHLIPGLDVHSPVQFVQAEGARLATFADDALFTYLCVHGMRHGWARLKWLADLGAFIASRDPHSVERMYNAALAAGAGRAPAVSLLLCRRLLGVTLPPALDGLDGDRRVRHLEAMSLRCIGAVLPPGHPAAMPNGALHLSQLLLASGLRYRAEQLWSIWIVPSEHARFGFAAHLLRIPLWLARIARRFFCHFARPTAKAASD